MKNLLSSLVLTVSLTLSAGQYLLPIGSNVNRREAEVALNIGNTSGWWVDGSFSYQPSMGPLESVIEERLRNLARGLTPPVGSETNTYWWGIISEQGPYAFSPDFKLQQSGDRWIIPPEALEVELQYGEVTVTLTGVTKVKIEVRGGDRTEHFSSDGSGIGSPCYIQAVDRELGLGLVILAREYVNPKYRAPWITEGEVTLYESALWARFNILDGMLIDTSPEPPAFLAELKVEPIPPRITGVRRVEDTTEITVESETAVILEFSENAKDWSVVGYPTITIQSVRSRIFSHQSSSASGFYRVRLPEPPTN